MENSRIAPVVFRTFASLGLFLFAAAAHTSGMEPAPPTSAEQKKRCTFEVADEDAAAYDFTEFRKLLTEPVHEGRIPCASAILIHNNRVIFK